MTAAHRTPHRGKPLIPFTPHENPENPGPVTGYATPLVFNGGPGGLCFYDWLEFSFAVDKTLYINTTQVDQYGFSISVDPKGTEVRTEPQGLYKKNRSGMLRALAQDEAIHPDAGSLFSTTVGIPAASNEVDSMAYPPFKNTKSILRALAPSKALSPTGQSDYLDGAIEAALNSWENSTLEVTCPSNNLQATYYGKTDSSGKKLNFYKNSSDNDKNAVFFFDQLSTKNVLECHEYSSSKPAGDLLVDFENTGKAVLAGFNRGVITPTTRILNITADDQGSKDFVPPLDKNYADPSVRYNRWAKQFHDLSQNGKAYGFAYDDVGKEEPLCVALGTTSILIKLGKFE